MAFDTNDYSFHGLPDPINFPKGHARRSIILFTTQKSQGLAIKLLSKSLILLYGRKWD